jgi:hypothetical protein
MCNLTPEVNDGVKRVGGCQDGIIWLSEDKRGTGQKLGELGGERTIALSVEGALERSHASVRDEVGNEGITVQ